MIAVIFEVWPAEGKRQAYLDMAARMRPIVEEIPGFVSVERFESLTEPGKLLSISVFENEDAVREWREKVEHRGAQRMGRGEFFADYRLRVTHVLRDYGKFERAEAPADSREEHGS